MLAMLFAAGCAILGLAYISYGRWVEKKLGMDDHVPTPAVACEDGFDYVPTPDPVVFGHHFSSIAGAGPIVGPIIAGLAFGWLPALLWIVVGAILVGGIHDFASLAISIRHGGQSIGRIFRRYLDRTHWIFFLLFTWFTLIYVLIVFLDLTASTFAPPDEALYRQGGIVATSSSLYILIALLLGYSLKKTGMRLGKASLLFLPLVFLALWVGTLLPMRADRLPLFMGSAAHTWRMLLLIYCLAASITPVWALLQPRDYLSSFLLFACLLGGGLGVLAGGITGSTTLSYTAFRGFHDTQLGFIFPALFITVACGAVSGFHSIVASGTTAKQLRRASSARRIGYGSMLVEAILALIALSAVMVLGARPEGTANPVAIFGSGIGLFTASLGLPRETGELFGVLAVSTFLLTTLDTCTRLARFILQELTGMKGKGGRALATVITLLLPGVIVFLHIPGPGGISLPAWRVIWPAFGATNQLLAALALLTAAIWLRRAGHRALFVLLPMLFMFVTTLAGLAQLVHLNLFREGSRFVGWLSLFLGFLALWLLARSIPALRRAGPGENLSACHAYNLEPEKRKESST